MARPKKPFSQLDYCQYLLSSQVNYTLTNYAEHVTGVSHDLVKLYLETERLSGKGVWSQVKTDIVPSKNGYVVFDDTVLDKNHSRRIESVRWQYSGNAHGIIRGIGLVNCIYINPETQQFWIIDFRIFDPAQDGKGKVDHVKDMLTNLISHKGLPFKTVLMDTWYATAPLMLFINDHKKIFYCPMRKNRLVKSMDTHGQYLPARELQWTPDEISLGKKIRLKGMPEHLAMKMFSVAVSPNRTDYVVTNDTAQQCADDTKKICAIRWYVEQFHREIKQLTGVDKCQCRKQRIQRNHIACAIHVWVLLKKLAYKTGRTVYQIKKNLLKNYLVNELREPSVRMSFS
ncbi:MAG: transposase [Legionellales bacterium RIFCSPHIGHO2_12_FULL_37_14]|nr:MAG: transposase [Legionellales bacterium RIFCSPHIGHO2_12_FULL_37_14]